MSGPIKVRKVTLSSYARVGALLCYIGFALVIAGGWGSNFSFLESGGDSADLRSKVASYNAEVILPLVIASALAGIGAAISVGPLMPDNPGHSVAILLIVALLSVVTAVLSLLLPLRLDFGFAVLLGVNYGAAATCQIVAMLHPNQFPTPAGE